MLKLGLIREYKQPPDRRVAFTPLQCAEIKKQYGNIEIMVESSPDRIFTDEVYKKEGIIALQQQLNHLDPEHYNNVDLNNPQRLMRALEICLSTGRPYSTFRKGKGKPKDYTIIKI